jgi:diguanylate cyclase (GGDEF)-like protein/PAS domain S-box-containing protein
MSRCRTRGYLNFTLQWALLALVMAATGALLAWTHYTHRQEIEAAERNRLVAQLKVIDNNLARQLDSANKVIASVRDDLPFLTAQKNAHASIERRLQSMVDAMPGVRAMIILDAQGTLQHSSDSKLVGQSFKQRDYFATAQQSSDATVLHVSAPFKSAFGDININLFKTIRDEKGAFAGLIGCIMNRDYFSTLLGSVLYAPDMRSSVAHGDGHLFMMVPPRPEIEGINLNQPGSFHQRHQGSGQAITVMSGTVWATQDERMLAEQTVMPPNLHMDQPLYVAISRDLPSIFAQWRQETITEAWLFAAVTVLLAFALWLYQRRQTAFGALLALQASERDQHHARISLQAVRATALLNLPQETEDLDEQATMQRGLAVAEQFTGSQISFIHFVKDDQQTIELLTWSAATLANYYHAVFDKHYPISQAGIWADALRQRHAVVVNDYANVLGKHDLPEGHASLTRLISVPVMESDKVRMMMGVGNKPEAYDDFDVETTRLIADSLWRLVRQRRADALTKASEKSLENAQILADMGSYDLDFGTQRWACSAGLDHVFGISADYERTVNGWLALVHPDDRAMVEQHLRGHVVDERQSFSLEYRIIRQTDQAIRWVKGLGKWTFDDQSQMVSMQGTIQDVTVRKAAQQQLLQLSQAVEQSSDSIVITDLSARIDYVNDAFVKNTGYAREEVIGQNPRVLQSGHTPAKTYTDMWQALSNGQSWRGELHNRRKDGSAYTELALISPMRNAQGIVTHYVAAKMDVTAQQAAAEQIETLVFYDPLTGLPNRRLLMDRLQHALAMTSRSQDQGVLMMIDLDHFKNLNDTLGHEQGDQLLQLTAQRLRECVRESDTVARLGGDEFMVLAEGLGKTGQDVALQARLMGEKIVAALGQPYVLASGVQHSSASVGISLFDDTRRSVHDEPLKQAELAMYQAKEAGGNTLRFFDQEMQAVVSARASLEFNLRDALALDQFLLYYQIQVNVRGQPIGAEALIRWMDPRRGMVAPAEFIPLCEETGLILPLGQWVLETGCAQLARWARQPHLAGLTLAINVSARQFNQQDFVDNVLSTLEKTDANPRHLKLELTESMLVHDVDAVIAKMGALKARGVSFSLDDFGTGYSSLAYLKRLPLDQLKIDQGFVRDILVDPNDAAIARMVIALADTMGLAVIAEGVETRSQRDFLAESGCHAYQGYLFGRPVPVDEFEAMVPGG